MKQWLSKQILQKHFGTSFLKFSKQYFQNKISDIYETIKKQNKILKMRVSEKKFPKLPLLVWNFWNSPTWNVSKSFFPEHIHFKRLLKMSFFFSHFLSSSLAVFSHSSSTPEMMMVVILMATTVVVWCRVKGCFSFWRYS